jgi:hypothetical protein
MTISIQALKKTLAVFSIFVLFFVASSSFASAQTYYYPTTVQNSAQIQSLLSQVYALIAQLQALQAQTNTGVRYTYTYSSPQYVVDHKYNKSDYGDYDVEVDTKGADADSDDSSTLSGKVDLDDASYAYVWFDYGQDGDLDEESKSLKLTSSKSFEIEIDDLDEDEKYYYRAVAEDPSGYRVYGSIESFTSGKDSDDDDSDDDIPDVQTEDASNVTDDSAKMSGEVDMNDFEDGIVFLVYGEDEGMVEDVENENQYGDIDEDGDDLQTVTVYSGLDDDRTFWYSVSGLDDNTDYYFRYCVEYEDEDGDETLECGSVEHFETD